MEGFPIKTSEGNEGRKFKDTISIDTPMSPHEAVEAIANFHNTQLDAVREAFLNLRESDETNTVVFRTAISNGDPCLKIEIHNADDSLKVFSLIDAHTGQPIAHIS